MQRSNLHPVGHRLTLLAVALALAAPAWAEPSFLGVSAGDASSHSAMVWTRATEGAAAATGLKLELSTTAAFSRIAQTVDGLAARDDTFDFTLKQEVTGLKPGTTYFYRFSGGGSTSPVGRFTTAPAVDAAVPVRFSFSGDADGSMRPYMLTQNFQAATPRDFFVFLGDTLYQAASNGSPAAFIPPLTTTLTRADQASLRSSVQRKYREQFVGVNPATGAPTAGAGPQGLSSLYAAQGNYTQLDNHELGNRQYINGGAPLAALTLKNNSGAVASAGMDVNTSGSFVNKSHGYRVYMQAYNSYQPVREEAVAALPGDSRSAGAQKLYGVQNWGKNLGFINVDDRSYRDVRIKSTGNNDDTPASYVNTAGSLVGTPSNRWANPDRTMLGDTQFNWLKQTLLEQQATGQKWKVVALSSPIDQAGNDGGKSFYAGYQAERNALLKFIDDNRIQNVVFLTTDDHLTRVNQIWYSDAGVTRLSSAFTIVTGPLGATGPDAVTDHGIGNLAAISSAVTSRLTLENTALNGGQGGKQLGLKDFGGRIGNIKRDRDGVLLDGAFAAGGSSDPLNFFSPDTFAYTNLDVDAGGKLTVTVWGIESYAVNSFPQASPAPRVILSFDMTPAREPASALPLLTGVGQVAGPARLHPQRAGVPAPG